MKRLVAAGSAVLALLLAPSLASAQDEWERQVREMLVEAGKAFESEGYSLTHRLYTGSLDGDTEEEVTLDLDIGTEYFIMGACDTDCSDLDLWLYDGYGNELDEDIEMDDFPIVHVVPTRSGTFTVRVGMVTCDAEPCRYGIGVFGR